MKKFFEEPIVELEKFEVADVIAASIIDPPRDENEGDLDYT